MFLVSMVSALLSSMSFWADKWSDVRLSMNDIYMASLMTGWMFFLEGLLMNHTVFIVFGLVFIVLSFLAIRYQIFITVQQYVQGMIPHHSMAILMSKRLTEKYGENILNELPKKIINTQESEIQILKRF